MLFISPTQSQIQAALVSFLNSVLPTLGSDGMPISVVEGIDNRAPEPEGVDFIVFSVLSRPRLSTNVSVSKNAEFVGFIVADELFVTEITFGSVVVGSIVSGLGVGDGTVILSQIAGVPGGEGAYRLQVSQMPSAVPAENMTVGDAQLLGFIVADKLFAVNVTSGEIETGQILFADGVVDGVFVLSQISGVPGGAGTYSLSNPQAVPAQTLSASSAAVTQKTEVVFQLDVHGANLRDASDMAETITTIFRDPYAVGFFQGENPAITPLHADDPTQVAFVNAEDQYESRYVVEARLQVDQTVSGIPQQFADSLEVDVISVQAEFPH